MSESVLKKRMVHAGDVLMKLVEAGWTPACAASLLSSIPTVSRSSGDFESLHEEISYLKMRAEAAEKQRDAALTNMKCTNSDRERWKQIAETLNKRVDELEAIVEATGVVAKVNTETLIHAIKECLCNGCSDGPMERCEVCCKYHRIAEGIESEIKKVFIKNDEAAPFTNGDLLRSMSDQSLGEWICSLMTAEGCDTRCPAKDLCGPDRKGLVRWMKEETVVKN